MNMLVKNTTGKTLKKNRIVQKTEDEYGVRYAQNFERLIGFTVEDILPDNWGCISTTGRVKAVGA